jgi:signal transduction histidine kinase
MHSESGLVAIEVKDTGIGIEPRNQEAIFERFYEVTNVLHHSSGDYQFRSAGLGLGLAAARAIAAAHGSKVELRSAPNAGSTFTVRFATA